NDYDEKNIHFNFSNINIVENNEFISLKLEGTNSILVKKDHYIIPIYEKTIQFPIGTEIIEIKCTPQNIYNKYTEKEVIISPDPVIIGEKAFDSINYENQAISINHWFDYKIGTGIQNNERVLFIKITTYPIHYLPSENKIEWTENIEIEIKYNLPESQMSFNDDYSFLIISPSEFIDELNDLVNHKISRNISTNLVTLEEIYAGNIFPVEGRDEPEKIKYFIKNSIESWGITSVLLVGGSEKFPTRSTHIKVSSSDTEIFVSDLYYADIYNETFEFCSWDTNENDDFAEYDWGTSRLKDDVDLFPDIYIGRIACVDSDQVITSVNKIIDYETNVAYTLDWFTNLVVVGGDSFPGDDNEILEGEMVNNEVIDIMDGFITKSLNVTNGVLSKANPTGVTSISNAINEGCGFVDFSGHGNTNVWATHPHENDNIWLPTPTGNYKNSNIIYDLTNIDKLPIVITGACSVGKFNQNDNCFSWSFVANPNGGGIASCGATALGYAYIGEWVTYGLIEGITIKMFEAYKDGAITFGEMWANSLNNYISPGMDATDYKTIEEWQAFGDPTLSIAAQSLQPEKPNPPEGPTSANIKEEHTYTAITTDPDGDQIFYLFDWGDGEFSGWVGPYDSNQIGDASHIWTDRGDYEIRVKAKDDHGVQSEWSDPLPISMPKIKIFYNNIFLNLLEKFPKIFSLLNEIYF
ncbi:C25 family cysteine peptidase, partial [Thermoplasmatota archaeon]